MTENKPNERQLSMMNNALGREKRYRNHYSVNRGSEEHTLWLQLVASGLAVFGRESPKEPIATFHVSDDGIAYLDQIKEESCRTTTPSASSAPQSSPKTKSSSAKTAEESSARSTPESSTTSAQAQAPSLHEQQDPPAGYSIDSGVDAWGKKDQFCAKGPEHFQELRDTREEAVQACWEDRNMLLVRLNVPLTAELEREVEALEGIAEERRHRAKTAELKNEQLGHEVRQLREQNEALRSQLPEGMKHCMILFRECEHGHGRLTAANWIDHGCSTCVIEALQGALEQAKACLVSDYAKGNAQHTNTLSRIDVALAASATPSAASHRPERERVYAEISARILSRRADYGDERAVTFNAITDAWEAAFGVKAPTAAAWWAEHPNRTPRDPAQQADRDEKKYWVHHRVTGARFLVTGRNTTNGTITLLGENGSASEARESTFAVGYEREPDSVPAAPGMQEIADTLTEADVDMLKAHVVGKWSADYIRDHERRFRRPSHEAILRLQRYGCLKFYTHDYGATDLGRAVAAIRAVPTEAPVGYHIDSGRADTALHTIEDALPVVLTEVERDKVRAALDAMLPEQPVPTEASPPVHNEEVLDGSTSTFEQQLEYLREQFDKAIAFISENPNAPVTEMRALFGLQADAPQATRHLTTKEQDVLHRSLRKSVEKVSGASMQRPDDKCTRCGCVPYDSERWAPCSVGCPHVDPAILETHIRADERERIASGSYAKWRVEGQYILQPHRTYPACTLESDGRIHINSYPSVSPPIPAEVMRELLDGGAAPKRDPKAGMSPMAIESRTCVPHAEFDCLRCTSALQPEETAEAFVVRLKAWINSGGTERDYQAYRAKKSSEPLVAGERPYLVQFEWLAKRLGQPIP